MDDQQKQNHENKTDKHRIMIFQTHDSEKS